VLVLGVADAFAGPSLDRDRTPGLAFLLGKVLNAFLLDHVTNDLEHIAELNQLLADGRAAYGSEFELRLAAEARRRGRRPIRTVPTIAIRPSVDLGRFAALEIKKSRSRAFRSVPQLLVHLLALGEGDDADLASYFMFDHTFTKELVQLGRNDARLHRDELEGFLAGGAAANELRASARGL
jgi:NTE family protein